mgnify:CR=1 FL=1
MLTPSLTTTAATWGAPLPWRACALCRHGATVGAVRVCTCRDAVHPAQHQPVELVRRKAGACGPEAQHLDFPGLRG